MDWKNPATPTCDLGTNAEASSGPLRTTADDYSRWLPLRPPNACAQPCYGLANRVTEWQRNCQRLRDVSFKGDAAQEDSSTERNGG